MLISLDMLNKGGEIEQMIKPKDDMIESIQTKLIDKTEAIANLTKERMGSTVIMTDGRQTNVSPPPASCKWWFSGRYINS